MQRRRVLAVARRELAATFGQPTAYVFVASFLAVTGFLGLYGFFTRDVADLRDYFHGLRYAGMFLAPAAAMRAFAEERRQGTYELLFTLPLLPGEVVLGKYLAGLGLIAATLLAGLAFPLSLIDQGPFDLGQILCGFLGGGLLLGTYLALGLLASALTSNQVVAFVVGALACVSLGALGDPAVVTLLGQVLPGWAVGALSALGVGEHYAYLTRGVIALPDVVYFLALSGVALFWTVLAVERRPRSAETALAAALSGLALLLAIHLGAHPALAGRLDATLERSNSLSPRTLEVLGQVEDRLTIRVYLSSALPETTRPYVRELLDLLGDVAAELGDHGVLELRDPEASHLDVRERKRLIEQAARDGVQKIVYRVQGEGRMEQVEAFAGVSFHYRDRPREVLELALHRPNLEYDVAVAVQRLILPRVRVGWASTSNQTFAQAQGLLRQSYPLQELDLEALPAVPEEVGCLVFLAPLPPSERVSYQLDQFVARGGRLVLLDESWTIDPRSFLARRFPEQPLDRALAAWGLSVGPLAASPSERTWPFVTDGSRILNPYPYYVRCAPEHNQDSPVVGRLGEQTLFFAGAVELAEDAPGATTLVRSGPGWTIEGPSWDAHPLRLPTPPAELQPVTVAAAVRGRLPSAWAGRAAPAWTGEGADPLQTPTPDGEVETVVAVVGDVDFARDANQTHGAGAALVAALVDWSLDRSLAGVRGRRTAQPLYAGDFAGFDREAALNVLHVVLLPLLVLGGGLGGIAFVRLRRGRAAARRRDRLAAAVGEAA
ncbi:MAG: Gldg family protein [Planctomycetota bacterium]